MGKKLLKKYSTPLVIREMQIKMTLRFYLIPIRMTKIKNSRDNRCWQGCGGKKRNTPPLLVGLQTGTTTVEINLTVPRKSEIVLPEVIPNYTTPGHTTKRCPTMPEGHVIHYVHSSLVYDSWKLKTTQISHDRRMDTENVVHLHNEILSAIKI